MWGGLTIGAVGATLGVAVVVGLRATGVLNLAVGSLYVLGALAFHGLTAAGLGVVVALALSVAGGGAAGLIEEVVVLRPLRREHVSLQMLATIAFAVIVQGALIVTVGRDLVSAPSLITGTHRFGTTFVSWNQVLLVGTAVAVGIGAQVRASWSRAGLRAAAVSDDREAAEMIGIDVDRLRRWQFVAVGALCAFTGVLGVPLILVDVNSGLSLAIAAFVAAVVGGGRRPVGALVGGLAVGVIESFGARMFSNAIAQGITAAVLIVLVVAASRLPAFRPAGER